MATLDSSIVNIALPTLTKTLGTDLQQVKWIVVVYLLCITCLLLPFGRLADRYGRKRVFQAGFIVFAMASLWCGLSLDFWMLLLGRVLQGVGAALLMANGPAIITQEFPLGERGRALGVLSMIVSAGLISGPSLGGVLIHTLGWRSIFWVNIPVGLLGALLVQKHVHAEKGASARGAFDWPGAILQALFLVCFVIFVDPPAISIAGQLPISPPRWLSGVTCLGLLIWFIRVERRTVSPLFELMLLKIPSFGLGNLAGFLTFVAYSAMTVLMPFFLEEVLHFSTRRAGLAMTMLPLTIFLVAPVSGRLSDRIGTRGLAVAGGVVGAIGFFLMAGGFGNGIHEKSTWLEMALCLGTIGLATGLFQSPNNSAIMGAVPHGKLGVASALLATIRNLGIATGTGLASGLFSWHFSWRGDYVSALHFVFYISGITALGAAGVSALRRKKMGIEKEEEEDDEEDMNVDFESRTPLVPSSRGTSSGMDIRRSGSKPGSSVPRGPQGSG